MQGEELINFVHDIKNPLSTISLAAENLRAKAKDPELDKFILLIEKKLEEIVKRLDEFKKNAC